MKDTKRRFLSFSFYDHTGMEHYLEKQAEQGWMLDKISSFGWRFRRIEPQKIHFSVIYFPKSSSFDPGPSEKQLEFQDFCEHAGWMLATANAPMHIFYNRSENPTPIETDAELEINAIHESARKTYLPSYYLLLIVALLQEGMFFSNLISDPVFLFSSTVNLFNGLNWFLILLMVLVEIGGYHLWHRRAKNEASLGGNLLNTKGTQKFQYIVLALVMISFVLMLISFGGNSFTIILLATVLFLLLLSAIIVWVSKLMKKMNFSAKLNRTLTILLAVIVTFGFTAIATTLMIDNISELFPERAPVSTYEYDGWIYEVYKDDIPLKIEDLVETDYTDYSYEIFYHEESVFLEQMDVSQSPKAGDDEELEFYYSIVNVKFSPLYNLVKNSLLDSSVPNNIASEDEDLEWWYPKQVDAAPWGAKEAYQIKQYHDATFNYLLCYENKIIEINFYGDWKLTPEQMAIVGEKLENI